MKPTSRNRPFLALVLLATLFATLASSVDGSKESGPATREPALHTDDLAGIRERGVLRILVRLDDETGLPASDTKSMSSPEMPLPPLSCSRTV